MSKQPVFLPKALTCLKGYTRAQLVRDLLAGVTVGLIALPLALAFGIASVPDAVAAEAGLSPAVMGLVTAIIAGAIISGLGGTRVCIGGPTGAFVVIVYGIAAEHGYNGLVLATMLAGVILIVLGVSRLGGAIKFIPYPVTMGFTAGIGVVIMSGQFKDLLGLEAADAMPPEFFGRVMWYFEHAGALHRETAMLGIASVLVLWFWPKRIARYAPGPVVVLVLGTAAAWLLKLDVETVAGRYGAIPRSLPALRTPEIDWSQAHELVGPAFAIAMLAAIESLLCAVVADGMIGSRHRSNTELIAQGVANVAAPVFGGIPATGAIARTAANVQSGGRTPIAGVVHAATLLAIVLAAGPVAGRVPLCTLAAVLVVVSRNMMELPRFLWVLRGPRSDAAVLVCTFLLTVVFDLTVAVQAGMVLAALLFIKRIADATSVVPIRSLNGEAGENGDDVPTAEMVPGRRPPSPGIEVYDINGPFFFGAAFKLREALDGMSTPPRLLILNLERVPTIDSTGLHALDELLRRCRKLGTRVVLAGVGEAPGRALARAGLMPGPGDVAATVESALWDALDSPQRTSAGQPT